MLRSPRYQIWQTILSERFYHDLASARIHAQYVNCISELCQKMGEILEESNGIGTAPEA